NVMIVDSSALLEQAVADALTSAFSSAGQRCSCLRVVFVQEEIAAAFIAKLDGALQEIEVGDPLLLATDVGPLIDADALDVMRARSDVARRCADGKRYRVRFLFFAASFRN
ncbi:MAG: hypothetical protein CFH39_00142, partial [Alphaproteobacteria bacterium MarineAlpha10_Bin2]